MEIKNEATETSTETIATQDDVEAKIAELEAEKAKLTEEAANYKVAYLKEHSKNKENADEPDDERMERIAKKALADSRLADIAREQDAIIKKALKENSEMKRSLLNKTDIPVSTSTHSEGRPVTDTIVTPDQLAAFKARGWNDKDIENYKKNLNRYK